MSGSESRPIVRRVSLEPGTSSSIRDARAEGLLSPELRVGAFLRSLGLEDEERRAALSLGFAQGQDAAAAVRRAQADVAAWLARFERGERIEAAALRALARERPELFLAESRDGDVRRFFRGMTGFDRTSIPRQELAPVGVPRWLLGTVPPTLASAIATSVLVRSLASPLGLLDLAFCALFYLLFWMNALAATIACFGLVRRLRRPPVAATSGPIDPEARTVVAIPIYQESPEDVFARIAAMREALRAGPDASTFEIFVLSDTRDPRIAAEEERCVRRVAYDAPDDVPVFYRRRRINARQKSGNLEEFLERWGHRYRYMVVLDADSLVGGATLAALVRRMEAAPGLGLLQLPIEIVRAETLFARAQQFAASLYGPIFTSGLSAWVGVDGNYYGHNAILRVDAFVACCGLPSLEGQPPFGGHILSHDFVEAALLRRGGWDVELADDLGESYEETPPTFADYATRDRRWCQGNLQHLRVLLADRLTPMSRIHLLLGAFAYLASPLWIVFAALGFARAAGLGGETVRPEGLGALLGVTFALLLGAKLLAFLQVLLTDARRFGGVGALALGFVAELLGSSLLAPRLMLRHAAMVAEIVVGRAVGWQAQRRVAGGDGWRASFHDHGVATLIGLVVGIVSYRHDPRLAAWLVPLTVPLLLSIPFDGLTRSLPFGRLTKRLGLFAIPAEVEPTPILRRNDELRGVTLPDAGARFRDLVLDPVLHATHVAKLRREGTSVAAPEGLAERALAIGPGLLSERERELLAADADVMEWLHPRAWAEWPVETWFLGRELSFEPSEGARTKRA